jgi:hypothetical protein
MLGKALTRAPFQLDSREMTVACISRELDPRVLLHAVSLAEVLCTQSITRRLHVYLTSTFRPF